MRTPPAHRPATSSTPSPGGAPTTSDDLGADEVLRLAQAITAAVDRSDSLTALRDLHRLRALLDRLEPGMIDAARRAGASWQTLAHVLGVTSRQAAERRYLRLVPATADQAGSTREQRVQQVRDQRAGNRAVNDWANHNTADLRRLAAQITALGDLGAASGDDIAQLNHALADTDATALPAALARIRPHLDTHPALARRVDTVTAETTRIRQQTQHHRQNH